MEINNDEHDLFEKQFAQKHYLNTPFGKIETVDISPLKLTHSIPILLAPGWGETLELQKQCLKEIYLSGRRILALHHAVLIQKSTKATQYPFAELQKAETLLLLLQQKQIKKVDIISHSEGSINVAIAATMQPSLFRNLILVTPAGVSGKDKEFRIIVGFLRHVLRTRAKSLHHSLRILEAMKKPRQQQEATLLKRVLSFKQEITAMASFDIHPLLINLRKHSIKIAILAGEIDTAFPIKRMREHLEKGIVIYNLQTEAERKHYGLDIFATKKGGHELYTNTHEIMQQVLYLLATLTVGT